jgi:hypothetical protein
LQDVSSLRARYILSESPFGDLPRELAFSNASVSIRVPDIIWSKFSIIRSLKSVLGQEKVCKIRVRSVFFYVNAPNERFQLLPTLSSRFAHSKSPWVEIVELVACFKRAMPILCLVGHVLVNEWECAR